MHGLGATFVGSVLSIPLWIYTHFKLVSAYPSWYHYIIPIIVTVIHFINFRRVIKSFQSVVDIIFCNEFKEESTKKNGPVIINLATIDHSSPDINS